MTKKIVQVKKRESVLEKKVSCAKRDERPAQAYVVKSKYSVLREELNQKYPGALMRHAYGDREPGLPMIVKALQQKEKYVKKGGPCMVKKEIGARF